MTEPPFFNFELHLPVSPDEFFDIIAGLGYDIKVIDGEYRIVGDEIIPQIINENGVLITVYGDATGEKGEITSPKLFEKLVLGYMAIILKIYREYYRRLKRKKP